MSRCMLMISIILLLLMSPPGVDAAASSSAAGLKLTPSDSGLADHFGLGVALSMSGDTLVVGAPHDVGGSSGLPAEQGVVYVFERDDGAWLETARLTAADGHLGDQFGFSVDINSDGRRIVIGATESGRLGPLPRKVGAAYVFKHQGDTWVETAKFSGDEEFSQFGRSVAISRDTVVVGAEEEDASRGAAYVFAEEGGQWSRQAKLSPLCQRS